MSTIYVLVGLPASGKTTIAKKMVEKGCKRVNKDDLRAMIDFGNYSLEMERFINAVQEQIIWCAIKSRFDIVVDNTNLNPVHIKALKYQAIALGANIEIRIVDTPVQECIRRDALRDKSVGEKRINDMYDQYLELLLELNNASDN